MNKDAALRVISQGAVELSHLSGYLMAGSPEAECACFFIDPVGSALVEASTTEDDLPVVYLGRDDMGPDDLSTAITFPEFKGFRFHCGGSGKTIAITLVRRTTLETGES